MGLRTYGDHQRRGSQLLGQAAVSCGLVVVTTVRAGSLAGLCFAALLAAGDRLPVNNGAAHGDPPYLLENGWTALINGKDLQGWRFEKPEKAGWTATRAVFWDAKNPKELMRFPGPGDRIANGPKGAVSNIVTTRKFGDVELYLQFLVPAESNSGVYMH